jgi:hypothetical protein
MVQTRTIKRAANLIEEFRRRCRATLGDPPEISRGKLAWLQQQAEAWPYGEPNLFDDMACVAMDASVADTDTSVLIPENSAMLRDFGFSESDIEAFNSRHCPLCHRPVT